MKPGPGLVSLPSSKLSVCALSDDAVVVMIAPAQRVDTQGRNQLTNKNLFRGPGNDLKKPSRGRTSERLRGVARNPAAHPPVLSWLPPATRFAGRAIVTVDTCGWPGL